MDTATADPTLEQGNPEGVDPGKTGEINDDGNGDGKVTPKEPTSIELKTRLDFMEKQYGESSKEAVRLNRELQALQAKTSSLTEASEKREEAFPSYENAKSHLVDKLGFSDEQARFMYDNDKRNWEQGKFLNTQLKYVQNQSRFNGSQLDRSIADLNPMAKEAVEKFKDIPELDILPINEKVERYKKLQDQFGIKVVGRDTTAAKAAAGGTVSAGGGSRIAPPTADLETQAKEAGFPSFKAMEEYSNVSTDKEHLAWEAKWKPKK